MMKVIKNRFQKQNSGEHTQHGETFPLMFDVDDSITLEEFQELVDKSEQAINLING